MRSIRKNQRVARWASVCLEVSPDDLRKALRPVLTKWKERRTSAEASVAAMATAAALLERLEWLRTPVPVNTM